MRKKTVVALIVGAVAIPVGSAGAAKVDSESFFKRFKLSETSERVTYLGRVGSEQRKCTKQRKVKIVRKRRGGKETVGTTKTDRKGKFKIVLVGASLEKGRYSAFARKRSFRKGGDKVVCEAAKSKDLRVQ